MKRTLAGFLIAPLITMLLFLDTAGFGLSFVMSYTISYIFGIPCMIFLKRKKKESHRLYSALGFVFGASYVIIINLFYLDLQIIIAAFFFGAIGLLTALCFSLIQGNKRIHSDETQSTRHPKATNTIG